MEDIHRKILLRNSSKVAHRGIYPGSHLSQLDKRAVLMHTKNMNLLNNDARHTFTNQTKIATVSLILLKENQVLLLRRHGTRWANGYYALVAGCVDPNESITHAMIREAREEANIILKPEWLTFGCVTDAAIVGRGNGYTCIDFYFIAHQWEGEIANAEPHKHEDLRFFPLDDLPKELLPFVKEAIFHSLEGKRYAEVGWDNHIEIT